MSSIDPAAGADAAREGKQSTTETLAGFLAAASIFASLVALAYHPVPLSVASALLALVASGISTRNKTLCAIAVLLSAVCFVAGLVIAIVTNNPLW